MLAKSAVSWLQPLAPQRRPSRPISGAINPAAFPARSRSGCLALATLIILLFPVAALSPSSFSSLVSLSLASLPPLFSSRNSLLASQILALVARIPHYFRLSDHRAASLRRFFHLRGLRPRQRQSPKFDCSISRSSSTPFNPPLAPRWFASVLFPGARCHCAACHLRWTASSPGLQPTTLLLHPLSGFSALLVELPGY